MRARFAKRFAALLAFATAAPACTQILGTYQQGAASKNGPCTHDTEDQDCMAGYGCQSTHCALRCASSAECGDYAYCSSNLCTPPIGMPCTGSDDYETCGSLTCETLDIGGQKTSGYCTTEASQVNSKQCPPGYVAKTQYENCLKQ
jgi:hypothetical protein